MTHIRHCSLSPTAQVTAAAIAGDAAPGVAKAAVTIVDGDRAYIVEFAEHGHGVVLLAQAASAIADLQADLRSVPPPIDLDALRRVRAEAVGGPEFPGPSSPRGSGAADPDMSGPVAASIHCGDGAVESPPGRDILDQDPMLDDTMRESIWDRRQ